MEQTQAIVQKIHGMLEPLGFEIYPFKVTWYNDFVEEKYKLPYGDGTLGILVISIPDMWEKAFIPFVKDEDLEQEKDILNQCMIHYFDQVKQKFPEHDIDVMHHFEKVSGQARILVQIAAHVSGAAYYYQRQDVIDQPWPADEKKDGLCYHPIYGGWISIEGAFIFKDVQCTYLQKPTPQDVIRSQKHRIEVLEKYNASERSFRDLFPVPRKYAEEHMEYLSTKDPQKRIGIVQRIKSSCTSPLLKEIHENHAQKKHNGSLVDSSDYLANTDWEKKKAVPNRKKILEKFPSVLTYIIGKINDEPAVKVFLKGEDNDAENYFRQSFHKHTMQFVNVTKEMEEALQRAPPDTFQPQMDNEIRKRLGEIIEKHSRTLMANHSQIIQISEGNMPEGTSVGKPCIVIYCLDKLLIPTGEQELPHQLEDYPVCIKEGFIMFGFCEGCENLKNGCSIGRPSDEMSGSIGFFVKVRKPEQFTEEKGFLTAAHVALPNIESYYDENKLLTQCDYRNHLYEIVHPSYGDNKSGKIIGKVSEAFCGNYGQRSIGIDAAFVNVYEDIRAHFELQIAQENELTFDGNTFVTKTGRTTSTTRGKLASENGVVRIPENGKCIFHNIYTITNLNPEAPFFRPGDSGSGVYLIGENGECNKALGIAFALLFGKQEVQTCVCKIKEIVNAFNINVYSVEEPIPMETE